MSEMILNALMQLFAIMARPDADPKQKRLVVASFLKQQLNREIVDHYLIVFDQYFSLYTERYSDSVKSKKNYAVSAVKVLKICREVKKELTHQQKIVVLVRLLDYAKTEGFVAEHAKEVIDTVAAEFFISEQEYHYIYSAVVDYFEDPDDSEDILLIDNLRETEYKHTKHIYQTQLKGQIRIYNIRSANIFLLNFFGDNDISLNGQFLQPTKAYLLSPGSSIRHPQTKPIYYSDIVNAFISDDAESQTVFHAQDIGYRFNKHAWGFHKISFYEKSGRLVGIMGASGTGKTTLLNVLNGSNPPTTGQIFINGVDIHLDKHKTKGIIGYVSQDDLLIEELTVFENLYYNAKLSFSDLAEAEILDKVENLLLSLGLNDVRMHQVGSVLNKVISGGQRKRLNIALELIREPTVMFLDEPTSGLSSRDSENILDLLKELTRKGKLIFVVIHQPSSAIFKMFDKLYLLDQGGFLIYRGDPVESISYFKSRVHQADWNDAECHVCGNVNPEQIFSIIDGKVVDEFGSLTNTRKIPAREWSEYFFKYIPQQSPNIYEYRDELKVSYSPPNWWQQFKIFIARDFRSKYANKGAQILNIMLAPILAVILTYIIKTYNVGEDVAYVFERNTNFPVYLFMAVIVAIFMGLTGSAQEIIKDRKILKREKFLSLSWSSYLLSKLGILLGIAALQSFLFVLFGNWIIELPGMFFPYWAVLFSVWASGIIMGLIVSDSVEREVTIYILIPFLIIPQIILSGIIIKFDKLNPDISTPDQIPWYGEIMTARWGYEALAVHQFIYNDFNKPIYKWERQMSNAQYITDNWFTEINRRLDFLKQNAGKTKWEKENLQYIALLKTEIPKMMTADNGYLHIDLNNLSIKAQNLQSDLKKLSADLWVLKNDFNNRYLEAEKEEQEYVNKIIGIHGRDYYRYLKEHNQNEKMQQMLKNRDFSKDNRIVEYEGRLIRKYEPVFQDPMFKTLRAHFFAPRKRLGNFYIETLWANVLIMWLMFGGMYVVLYTQWLKKLLAYISRVKFFQFFFKRVI